MVVDVWKDKLDLSCLFEHVRSFGVPNYRGAHVVLNNTFDKNIWLNFLEGYSDQQVIEHIQYGWPASYESMVRPALGLTNHPSALQHPEEIEEYIEKEVSHDDALIGPFSNKPFSWQRVDPLMFSLKKRQINLE